MFEPPSAVDLYKQLDTPAAAEFLDTTPITLERRRRDGNGPRYVRLGHNTVRYRLIDLIKYQEAHLVPQEMSHAKG